MTFNLSEVVCFSYTDHWFLTNRSIRYFFSISRYYMLNDRANSFNMFWGRVGFIDAINLHSFKIILILYDFNFSTFHFDLFGELDFQMTFLNLNIEVITCCLLVMWSAFLLFVEFVITVNFEFWLVSWCFTTSSKKTHLNTGILDACCFG